jgi:hypothetical protein
VASRAVLSSTELVSYVRVYIRVKLGGILWFSTTYRFHVITAVTGSNTSRYTGLRWNENISTRRELDVLNTSLIRFDAWRVSAPDELPDYQPIQRWRIVASGMLRRVALVITDVSEERSASFIMIIRIGELGTTLAVTSNRSTLRRLLVTASDASSLPILINLMMEALRSSETSALTRATRRNIPEYKILHSHRHENLKSYILQRCFYS